MEGRVKSRLQSFYDIESGITCWINIDKMYSFVFKKFQRYAHIL